MAIGDVGGARIAIVLCKDRRVGVTKSSIFAIGDDKIVKLGELLESVCEVRVQDGLALVRRTEGGWHAIDLPGAATRGEKKVKSPGSTGSEAHPLAGTTFELVERLAADAPPAVPPAVYEALAARCYPPGYPRMLGPDLAGALDMSGAIHLLREGELTSLHGGKLKKIHEGKLPRPKFRSGGLPTPYVTGDGELWISGNTVHQAHFARGAVSGD